MNTGGFHGGEGKAHAPTDPRKVSTSRNRKQVGRLGTGKYNNCAHSRSGGGGTKVNQWGFLDITSTPCEKEFSKKKMGRKRRIRERSGKLEGGF